MRLEEKITRGSLLKVTTSNAVLLMSDYCPKELREKFAERAKMVMSKLGTLTEPYQGIFYNPDCIVMENYAKTKRIRFSWTNDVLVTSDLGIPKSREKKRREIPQEAKPNS